MARSRLLPDNFTLTLIAVVALASLLPCSGQTAQVFGWVTNLAIALLFLLPGDGGVRIGRSIAFLVGAGFSACIGYLGMWLAV